MSTPWRPQTLERVISPAPSARPPSACRPGEVACPFVRTTARRGRRRQARSTARRRGLPRRPRAAAHPRPRPVAVPPRSAPGWSAPTWAKPCPARTDLRHHCPKRWIAASCQVISASSRQTSQPALRSRMQSSSSSAGDDALVVAAHGGHRVDAHQRVAAAGLCPADRRVPFPVAEPVVDRGLGKTLPAAPADDGGARVRVEKARPRRSIQAASTAQSPSTNWTYSGAAPSASAARPALRARAAVNGRSRASSTTSAPRRRAAAALPSVDPEVDIDHPADATASEARHASRRAPSLRPMTTAPMPLRGAGRIGRRRSLRACEGDRVVHALR